MIGFLKYARKKRITCFVAIRSFIIGRSFHQIMAKTIKRLSLYLWHNKLDHILNELSNESNTYVTFARCDVHDELSADITEDRGNHPHIHATSTSNNKTPSTTSDLQFNLPPPLITMIVEYLPLPLQYVHDLDNNGLMRWLGTNGAGPNTPFRNPITHGKMTVHINGDLYRYSFPSIHRIVDPNYDSPREAQTSTFYPSYHHPSVSITFDLQSCVGIQLMCYTLYHGSVQRQVIREQLLQWTIDASMDNMTWTILDERVENKEQCDNWVRTRNINRLLLKDQAFFRYIRLTQTGFNSSGGNALSLSNIEFYGNVHVNKT